MDDRAAGAGPYYVPPPSFAPPALRVAPLNEYQVLGRTSYPPAAQSSQSVHWAGYYATTTHQQPGARPGYAPVPWHPIYGAAAARPGVSRKITVLIGAAVVAALVAVVTLLAGAGPAGRGSHTLSIPDVAGQYSRVSTITGAQLQSLASGGPFASFAAADIASARVALYSRSASGEPTLVFIGFLADDSPTIGAELHSTEPVTVIDQVFAGSGSSTSPTPLDPGPIGGALECARLDVTGQPATVAVWADHDTLGVLMEYSSTRRPTISEMGPIARAMRAAAEK